MNSRNIGRISAAPSISAASTAKPEIRESPNQSKQAAAANAASASALW